MILEISRYGTVLATIQTPEISRTTTDVIGRGIVMTHSLSQLLGGSECFFELQEAALKVSSESGFMYIPGPLKVVDVAHSSRTPLEIEF